MKLGLGEVDWELMQLNDLSQMKYILVEKWMTKGGFGLVLVLDRGMKLLYIFFYWIRASYYRLTERF